MLKYFACYRRLYFNILIRFASFNTIYPDEICWEISSPHSGDENNKKVHELCTWFILTMIVIEILYCDLLKF